MADLTLHTYWRSSAAYRVRIALNLKGLSYKSVFVDLLKAGGENWKPEYRKINPQGFVPALQVGDDILTQSMAIIEYLDEVYPEPRLLPEDPVKKAYIRSLVQLIACDIHPVNNLRIIDYLKNPLGIDQAARDQWYQHWISEGFKALEVQLVNHRTGLYGCGDSPCLLDAFLIPQVYNAHRFHCDMTQFPVIEQVNHQCFLLESFQQASPDHQEDALK